MFLIVSVIWLSWTKPDSQMPPTVGHSLEVYMAHNSIKSHLPNSFYIHTMAASWITMQVLPGDSMYSLNCQTVISNSQISHISLFFPTSHQSGCTKPTSECCQALTKVD